jgi:hypothetical protein
MQELIHYKSHSLIINQSNFYSRQEIISIERVGRKAKNLLSGNYLCEEFLSADRKTKIEY